MRCHNFSSGTIPSNLVGLIFLLSNSSICATATVISLNIGFSWFTSSNIGSNLVMPALITGQRWFSMRRVARNELIAFSINGFISSFIICASVAAYLMLLTLRLLFSSRNWRAMSSSAIRHSLDALAESDIMSNVSSCAP